MFLSFLFASVLLSGSANAFTTPPPDPEKSTPLVMCYWKKAVMIGLTSVCHPPPMLVGAVYGACEKEEQEIRDKLAKQSGGSGAGSRIAGFEAGAQAIHQIHERLGPRIQGWILDAQASNGACRSKEP
jgi:hypothetical protein